MAEPNSSDRGKPTGEAIRAFDEALMELRNDFKAGRLGYGALTLRFTGYRLSRRDDNLIRHVDKRGKTDWSPWK